MSNPFGCQIPLAVHPLGTLAAIIVATTTPTEMKLLIVPSTDNQYQGRVYKLWQGME
jgi:hypothetical protein